MAVIFSDGFESGNFNAWTGTYGAWPPEVVSTGTPHHGLYHAMLDTAYDSTFAVYKTFVSGYPTFHARAYVKVANLGVFVGDGNRICFLGGHKTGDVDSGTFYAGLQRNAGTVQWVLMYRNGSNWAYAYSATPTPEAGKSYCLEVRDVKSSTVGENRLFVEGVEKITKTGLDNDDRGNTYGVLGFGWHSGMDDVEAYIDCVVAADAYIGVEAAGGQQLFTLINEMGY